ATITCLAYICASLKEVKKFDGDFKKWIDGLINKNSQENFWRDVKNEMKNIKENLKECSDEGEMTEWVKNHLASVNNEKIMREGSVKYLFAFDEARILVSENVENKSLFYYMRRALSFFPKKAGIFAIFTDTHSNISDFSPASYRDPSLRVAKGGPLWGALLSPPNEAKGMKPEHIVELAMDKLIGGEDFSNWRKKFQNKIGILETLAILGPRLCIEIVPQTGIA
ncbi:16387_t:CDS:2, partial [Racocetra fulgida]